MTDQVEIAHEIERLQRIIADLEAKNQELAEDRDALDNKVGELEGQNEELAGDVERLEDQVGELEDVLESRDRGSQDRRMFNEAVAEFLDYVGYHKPPLPEVLQKRLEWIDLLKRWAARV